MTPSITRLFAATILSGLAAVTPAVGQEATPSLDEAFAAAAAWRQGQSRLPLGVIEAEVRRQAGTGGATDALQRRLLELLEGRSTTDEAKLFACRQLALVGDRRSVPALASLLEDDATGFAARLALEAMPDAAAGAALVRALDEVDGPGRIGIAHSLAVRREPAAVAGLSRMLAAAPAGGPEWRAALDALVTIGGPAAMASLQGADGAVERQAAAGDP
ncbi:MAG: HEAT repeat domain-containing protein, partial [Planctomycetota bacterium]